jgi:hypothetical protein
LRLEDPDIQAYGQRHPHHTFQASLHQAVQAALDDEQEAQDAAHHRMTHVCIGMQIEFVKEFMHFLN